MPSDTMFLDNLDEYINDENKVVTYKWLSHTLSVHVNQAKQMLYAFIQQQRNEKNNDDLSVIYCVIGTEEKDGLKTQRVQLVPEESLEATKSKLAAISTCHIYSVQRAKLKDTNPLYMADYDLVKKHIYSSNKYSAITCMAAKLRSGDGVRQRMTGAPVDAEQPVVKANQPIVSSKPVVETKKAKAGAIVGMFAKATEKKSPVKDTSVAAKPKEKTNTSAKSKAKQGGVMGMFSKQANKPKAEPKKADVAEKEPAAKEAEARLSPSPKTSPTGTKRKGNLDTDRASKPKVEAKKKEPTTSKKAEPKSRAHPPAKPAPKGTKNKKNVESDEENAVGKKEKKRRRIQATWSSSEEEEEEEEEEVLDVVMESPPPSPPAAKEASPYPSPPPSPSPTQDEEVDDSQCEVTREPQKGGKKRIRRRKMVSKTTVNDEGFMVTEKVWEQESTDASEADEPPAKVKAPAVKSTEKATSKKVSPKKTSPQKGGTKQASMMSFFKKK